MSYRQIGTSGRSSLIHCSAVSDQTIPRVTDSVADDKLYITLAKAN